jgi:hypothetical protein
MSALRWEDPAPARINAVFNAELVAELRRRPGAWAIVRTYRRSRGRHDVKHPADIELRWQYRAGGMNLYARAV